MTKYSLTKNLQLFKKIQSIKREKGQLNFLILSELIFVPIKR